MHAAMTPSDIEEKLRSAFQQATVLKASYEFHESNYRNTSSDFVTPVLRTVAKKSIEPPFHHMKFPLMYGARSLREILPSSSSSDSSDSDEFSALPLQQHPLDASLEPDMPRPSSFIIPAGAVATSKKPLGLSALRPTPAIRMPFVTVYQCSNSEIMILLILVLLL